MPFFILHCLVTRRHANLGQRFGLIESARFKWRHSTRIWLHAASVGEVQAAKALILALDRTGLQADLVVSTVTEQGQIVARQQFGDKVSCIYAPVDLPWVIRKFIRVIQPSIYICMETELWPNMLRIAQKRGIKTLLLNGRMSDRSFRHYQLIGGFMKQILGSISAAATISTADMEKFIALGFARRNITVSGNAKYDNDIRSRKSTDSKHKPLLPDLNIGQGQTVLVAGSTHSGEEETLIQVHQALTQKFHDVLTIIAPRHLKRLPVIEAFFREKNIQFQKLSELKIGERSAHIVLVDYMGTLAALYSIADFAFCGGSLSDRGGHNIMEPAIWGVPPFYGPYMKDFADAARLFAKKKAGFKINSGQELLDKIVYFAAHRDEYRRAGQAAKALALSQQGAADRQVKLILRAVRGQEYN